MYDNFIMRAKRTVYKWWCLVYKPVYVLIYRNWPEEKDPYVRYPESKPGKPDADTAVNVDTQPVSAAPDPAPDAQHTPTDTLASETAPVFPAADTSALAEDEIPAGVDDDVLARANEIMARLNREAAEDEAKKTREIEAAREKADEQARLAAILKANERNIDAFIQEGLSSRQHPNT